MLDPGSIPVCKGIQRGFGVSQQKYKLSELPVVMHEGVVKSCMQKVASRFFKSHPCWLNRLACDGMYGLEVLQMGGEGCYNICRGGRGVVMHSGGGFF
jgi:hypothetical protein